MQEMNLIIWDRPEREKNINKQKNEGEEHIKRKIKTNH